MAQTKTLKPFQVPRRGARKDMRRHERAQDFDGKTKNWTPTELVRRDRLIRLNLGMEGTKVNTDQYLDGWDLAFNRNLSEEDKKRIEDEWKKRLMETP